MQTVILAAGKGKRLRPLSLRLPKAMMPVLGMPILERVMESFTENGIDDFIIVVNKSDREIVDYFLQECRKNVNIQFVFQEDRLGTGDALKAASKHISGDFIVSSCDNLFSSDDIGEFIRYHQINNNNATLSLTRVDISQISKMGIVDLEGDLVKRIVEKPLPQEASTNISSQCLHIFKPIVLDCLPQLKLSKRGEYELTDAIEMMIEKDGGVRGMFIDRKFHLTTLDDLIEINKYYLVHHHNHKPDPPLPFEVGKGTRIIHPVKIGDGTVIGEDCKIGPYVYIDENCRISHNVTIKSSLMLKNSYLQEGKILFWTLDKSKN